MGRLPGANFHQQSKQNASPPIQHSRSPVFQTSLSLTPSDARVSLDLKEPGSNSDQLRESPSESASSHEIWPMEAGHHEPDMKIKRENEKQGENECPEQSIPRASNADNMSLHDVARERVEVMYEQMLVQSEGVLKEIKKELRLILEGAGGSHNREEIQLLQRLVSERTDLTEKTLTKAHRVHLELLVAIKTGIQAFLHPNITLPQSCLIEIFLYKRCRNIACRSPLPAEDCVCELCTSKKGFCNLCMCVICNKFDFEVNTCRWIGCDMCSHWTHTDCAIHIGLIGMGSSGKSEASPTEMLFRCQACHRSSELLGWVKDVFQHCAPSWDRDALIRELDFVHRIFRGSDDSRGMKLFWKCEDVMEKMRNGASEAMVCQMMLMFFQELEGDTVKKSETDDGGHLIAPQEACKRIADVVNEAVRKMEIVAEEKMHLFKKARLALEACDRELEDKIREVKELEMERQRKKRQVDELEAIVRLKQAEADMFQIKANEARREGERLRRTALAKSDKNEDEYTSMYLKLRLNEAEAEKQYLFEKMKLHESSRTSRESSGREPSQSQLMLCKIQDLLNNAYSTPKVDERSNDHQTYGSLP